MTPEMLYQAVIYLAATVIAVPIAKRLGLGAVLGYLIAGVVIGPFGLHLIGSEGEDVLHVAEFGVVLMLFVVGLELEPALLWRLRGPIVGMGGMQVVGTSLAAAAIALVAGLSWQMALAIGMIVSLSSTAIVLQSLQERGLMQTAAGQSTFAVLLFQDIAVIPMLAIFPLLAPAATEAETHSASLLAELPAWAQTAGVLGAVAAVVVSGRFIIRPMLAVVARTGLRELFTAASLLIVMGIALLMTLVGLSPALGTFLAGVVLATSEYRHELESDIEPFKGLLLGLFFIAVGATIDFGLVFAQPLLILSLVLGILALKFALLFVLARGWKLSLDQALLFAFALPQVGEFAFVLFSYANQTGVLDTSITAPMVAAVALSMALTPLLLILNERVIQPRFGTLEAVAGEPDAIDEQQPVIIAGFGDFGSAMGLLLRANDVPTVVLDYDSDRVDLLRRMGLKVYYGDATRYDLLHTAGAERARLIVIALDTPEKTLELVDTVRKHFPNVTVLARAFGWGDAVRLYAAGVQHVYRESLDTALRMGTDALHMLGMRAYAAHRAALAFRHYDEESVRLMASQPERTDTIGLARDRIAELEQMFAEKRQRPRVSDQGWDAESLREEYGGARASAD